MKNKLTKFLPLVAVLGLLIASASFVSVQSKVFGGGETAEEKQTFGVHSSDRYSVIQQGVALVLAEGHLDPKPFDDKLSSEIYEEYLSMIDFNKHFLLKEDVDQLSKFEFKIDDEILLGTHQFFSLSDQLISERVLETSLLFDSILTQPFDFTLVDSIELDNKKLVHPVDNKERVAVWHNFLKYQTLSRLIDLQEAEEKNDSTEHKSFDELEAVAREKVGKSQKSWFRRLGQLDTDDRFSFYINSITAVFDPHTTYLPPKDKENFDIRFSGKLEGIGAVLRESDGVIKVDRIVTGSASWKQGELKAGDVITKVAQGAIDPVDISGMPLDDAVKLIRGKKGTEVRLTVKSKEGGVKVIPIIRDVVVLSETYAKSAIIEQGKFKIGVLDLPHFYADFNDRNGRNCYDDVEKELLKLNQEKVDGLVFDLRDNGGGSLQHVIEMVGLFVGKGPVVQTREKRNVSVKSSHTNQVFDKPVIVLINSNSASASEIFAAALQDYERAVVIGGNSSFGKGTVQNFADLDQIIGRNHPEHLPMGVVKLTIQKFYRVNGGSTQLLGVIPDIQLPDTYKYIEYGEKEYDYALRYDSIQSAAYAVYSGGFKRLTKVIAKSEKRTSQKDEFELIDENAKRVKEANEMTRYSLNIEQYKSYLANAEAEANRYKDMFKPIESLSIYSMAIDEKEIANDSVKVEKVNAWHKGLQKDPYLEEAINVLQDLD